MNEILFQKLERLKKEVLYLKTNKKNLLENLHISEEAKKIVERSVYLCAEVALDIADLVIVQKNFPKPITYSDTIYKLGDYKMIPRPFARKFTYVAGLRNFLAHDYLLDSIPALERFMRSGVADMEKFISYIEKL